MPGTLSDSWKLTKTSFPLLTEDRALLVFPVVAAPAIVGVLLLFLLGSLWRLPFVQVGGNASTPYVAAGVALFLVMYFGVSFVSVYASAALVGAATLKLNGQRPMAADGRRVARTHLARLAVWALINATVGLAIQMIASRARGIGGALLGFVGGATWAVATYFMIPVLVCENDGAWASLQRSARLFVSTFGRSLVTNLVIGLIVGGGIVAAVLLGILGLLVFAGGSAARGVVLLVTGVAFAVIVGLVGCDAEGVLPATLPRYATTGKIDPDRLPGAYRLAPGGTADMALR
ncbi:MAG: DUF6159 family protein [Thermoplasmata archaeon]